MPVQSYQALIKGLTVGIDGVTMGLSLQPASAGGARHARNDTHLGLLQGQESSTSGLDRMSSTQVWEGSS